MPTRWDNYSHGRFRFFGWVVDLRRPRRLTRICRRGRRWRCTRYPRHRYLKGCWRINRGRAERACAGWFDNRAWWTRSGIPTDPSRWLIGFRFLSNRAVLSFSEQYTRIESKREVLLYRCSVGRVSYFFELVPTRAEIYIYIFLCIIFSVWYRYLLYNSTNFAM